jgi:hypothetical protein
LKERQLRTEHINYGQKNEIGEKSREIGTSQSFSRVKRLALIFCPSFCASQRVYINLDSPNSKGFVSFPQFSRFL